MAPPFYFFFSKSTQLIKSETLSLRVNHLLYLLYAIRWYFQLNYRFMLIALTCTIQGRSYFVNPAVALISLKLSTNSPIRPLTAKFPNTA